MKRAGKLVTILCLATVGLCLFAAGYLYIVREPNLHDRASLSSSGRALYKRNRPDQVPLPAPDDRYVEFTISADFYGKQGFSVMGLSSHSADTRSLAIDTSPTTRSLLGVRPDLRLLSTNFDMIPRPEYANTKSATPQPTNPLEIYEQGIYPSVSPLQTHRVKFPKQYEIQFLALSPDGERLVWLVTGHTSSPLKPLFDALHWDASKYFPDEDGQALWISQWDGTDRHSLGFLVTTKSPISSVLWTADGRDITFEFDARRWMVPAK